MKNENCSCPNVSCKRHGNCEACGKNHKNIKMHCKLKDDSFKKRLIVAIFPLSVLQIVLYLFALGLLGFSIFYWVRLISQDLWDELGYRIIIMVLTIGAVISFVLARVLKSQAKILWQLERKQKDKDGNNVKQKEQE